MLTVTISFDDDDDGDDERRKITPTSITFRICSGWFFLIMPCLKVCFVCVSEDFDETCPSTVFTAQL